MNPQTPPAAPAAPTAPKVDNPLSVVEPGEQTICEIRRHPIGIVGMYAAAGLLVVLVDVAAFWLAPGSIALLISIVTVAIAAVWIGIAHVVYWSNRWVVTSDSITQVRRFSLFDKQTSQLSLGDLEDITAEQKGLLAQALHFGILSAETAGATDKFTFPFCPNPNDYAKQILAARERFEQGHREKPATG